MQHVEIMSARDADWILQQHHECMAEMGSSAFHGGADSSDAISIAGMMVTDDQWAVVREARAVLAVAEGAHRLGWQPPAPPDASDIPF